MGKVQKSNFQKRARKLIVGGRNRQDITKFEEKKNQSKRNNIEQLSKKKEVDKKEEMSSLKNTVKILYGLGNPSPNYDKTLHSIGKLYINHLARVHKAEFKPSRGKGLFTFMNFANRGEYALFRNSKGEQIALFKSDGFMNVSGVPYKLFLKNCDTIPLSNQYIVHDDLDSKPGKFKIKNGGSPEGHNGLRSIIDSIGNKDFQRLKIGIGRPDSKDPEIVANFVTSNMLSEEHRRYREEIFPQIDEFLKKNNIL